MSVFRQFPAPWVGYGEGQNPTSLVGYGQECGLVPVFSCGRSLCIDRRMVVVVEWNVLPHVKRRGNCPGGECLASVYWSSSQKKSLKFTINRTLMKLFRTMSSDVIKECRCFFGITDTKLLIVKRKWNSYVNIVALKMAYANCSQTLPVWNEKCWL